MKTQLLYRSPKVGIGVACVVLLFLQTSTLRGATPPDNGPALGKLLYDSRCAQCHGKDGKGDGIAASMLHPRPRNFTDGKYKFRSTESGSIPTDEDLLTSIRSGLHGTAMPDWKPFLNGDSLNAVLNHVKSFSPRFQNEKPKVVQIGKPIPSSPQSIAAGKKVFETLQCAACHGTDGAGTGAITNTFEDDWGHEIRPTHLNEPWNFRGGATPRDVYMRFRTGIDGTPMPSYVGSATDAEMWNLANYVVSLARKPVWEMNEQELVAFYTALDNNARQNPVERGKHLVSTLGCGFCHSPVRDDGSVIEELSLAGGQRWNLYPFDDVVSYNLTSDKETGLGNWTDDQIKTFLTKGIRRNGTRMIPFPMPWPAYAHLKADDLNAIVAYLRTLPPVYNKIPDPKSPNIFSYLWGKFQTLILKKDIPILVYPGNTGITKQNSTSANTAPLQQTQAEVRP